LGLALVLVGLGAGSFFTIQMVAAQNAIPQAQLGVGSGVIRYLAQLGMTLGAALIGIVVNGASATTRHASAWLLGCAAPEHTAPAEYLLIEGRSCEANVYEHSNAG